MLCVSRTRNYDVKRVFDNICLIYDVDLVSLIFESIWFGLKVAGCEQLIVSDPVGRRIDLSRNIIQISPFRPLK